MSLPTTPPHDESGPSRSEVLLEAAAQLVEKRIVALRSGTPILHATHELELVARGIRQLASECGRLQAAAEDHTGSAEAQSTVSGRHVPPVLSRVSRSERMDAAATGSEPDAPREEVETRTAARPRRWA